MSFTDCGIKIRTGHQTEFNTDPQMVLCFVKMKNMNQTNNTLHESDSFLVTNIDPDIDFKRYAYLRLCSYKKIKSSGSDSKNIEYFFKKLTRQGDLNDFESIDAMIKSNEIWDLWTILPDFKESLLESSLNYTGSQRKKFEKEGNAHFKRLYVMASEMVTTHIKAVKALKSQDSKEYAELTIQYYNQMKRFETLARKEEVVTRKEDQTTRKEEDLTTRKEEELATRKEEEVLTRKEAEKLFNVFQHETKGRDVQTTPTTEKISNFAFDVPSLPNELEFQKKILVFVGFLGLGYWAVRLLRTMARDKLEPVIDRFLSKIKSSRDISKKQPSRRSFIGKRLSSFKQNSSKPKVSVSSSKRKYPRKITKKSKSVR